MQWKSLSLISGQAILVMIVSLFAQDESRALAETLESRSGRQQVEGHLDPEASNAKSIGRVRPYTEIRLSIGFVIPKSAELQTFIKDAYDPTSPGYRKF